MPLTATTTRAAVIDDLDLVCSGLTLLLRRSGASTVESHRSVAAVEAIDIVRCELVLIGPHLAVPASQLVVGLRSRGFAGVAVHVTATVPRGEFVELLRSGTNAVVPFTAGDAELTDVLRRVIAGERVFDGVALEAVRPTLTSVPTRSGLTDREGQVLALLATRRTMAEIAAELYLSVATVKTHASNLYAKLGVRSRAEAVERAFASRALEAVV